MTAFLTIWGLIPSWLKLSLAALVVAIFISAGSYLYGKHEARQEAAIEAAKATAKAIQKRADIDDETGKLDPADLCKHLGGGVLCNDLK